MKAARTDQSSRRKADKRERGAALVETALVLMVTLSMIVFIMDMGRVLLTQQFISDRARVAVRNAVVNNWSSTAVANYVVYGSTTAPTGGGSGNTDSPPPGFMGLTTSQVKFTSYPDSGISDARYQVTVSGVPLFMFVPYLNGTYTAPAVTATAAVQSQGASN